EVAVAQRPAPEPVVGAVALEELVAGAIGVADLPDLPAVADGLPVELAQVQRLARFDRDVGLGVLAEDSVGEGMKRVGAGADVGDGEAAVVGAVGPELVVVAIVRPGDGGAVACAQLIAGCSTLIVRMGQTDGEMRERLLSRL